MKVELIHDSSESYWLASGDGPLRYILSEGASRPEAVNGYAHAFETQRREVDL